MLVCRGVVLECSLDLPPFLDSHVTNLREDILKYRLQYSLASVDEPPGEDLLGKAGKALEK